MLRTIGMFHDIPILHSNNGGNVMAERTNWRWSLSRLFKSNVISSTNPSDDFTKFLNKPVSQGNFGEFIDSTSLVNLNKIINDLRNPLAVHNDKYSEYKNMENEVIIAAALRSYADDATIFDNIKNVPVWIDTEDPALGAELTNFLSNIQIDYKLWGWAYQIAQFGDLYLENMYNKHGYLINIKPVSVPENILHLIDHEDDSEGFVVKRDDRKVAVHSHSTSEFDAYAINKFTHFYLDDTPRVNSVVIQAINEGGTISPLELNILKGRSILEPVRVNYRILRLLEDTVITNKIARSEYVRIFNVEVGEATGEGAARVINKLKRLFDAKPRFDGATGEYQSQRIYRPAADALFNSVNKGVGAIDVKELGGNVETQFIVDVEYFRSKMFAGLQIPKTFLGFEESLPTNPGDATLAKLDIRYTRAVRRVQLALLRGVEDLIDAYLVSRGRVYDTKKYAIRMTNPSSAEELSRLDETLKRIEVIDNIVKSVSQYGPDTVNLVQLYTELVDEYMDSPRIKEIFDDLLSKAIAISHLNINSQLNEARVNSINTGKTMYSTVLDLKVNGLLTEKEAQTADQAGLDLEAPGGGIAAPSFGGSDSFSMGGGSPLDLGGEDFGELGQPEELSTGEETPVETPTGGAGGDYEPGDTGIPLGSLSKEYDEDNPIESFGLSKIPGVQYYASNSNKLKLVDDLEKLAIHGPKDYRSAAESLTYKFAVEGFTSENIEQSVALFEAVNKYYNVAGMDEVTYRTVTETLLSRDIERKKLLFKNLLKQED